MKRECGETSSRSW